MINDRIKPVIMQRKEFTEENKANALLAPIKGKIDAFNSIHIDSKDIESYTDNKNQFKELLQFCVKHWKENNVKAIWIKISKDQLILADVALQCGFEMHHCTKDYIIFNQWLLEGEKSRLPAYTSHFIGAGGLILNDKNEMLMVQEKNGHRRGVWGIPGGMVDDNEEITEAAKREVWEETGLEAEPFDVLLFREVQGQKFSKSDIYFVILMKLKNQNQQVKLCDKELMDYKWVKIDEIDEFLKTNKVGPTQLELMKLLLDFKLKNIDLHKGFFKIEQGVKKFYGQDKRYSVFKPNF